MDLGREHTATFFFHDALEVFLPPDVRSSMIEYHFKGSPSLKDAIEAQGVPHPEVALLLVNGESVTFSRPLAPGDCIVAYPAHHAGNLPASRLPPDPDHWRFVLDVNLGKLTRWLRLLGFDSLYRNDFEDDEVAAISARDGRIALTRDRGLLFRRNIIHGYFVRADEPFRQLLELTKRYGLREQVRPFHRCTHCNGLIQSVAKDEILDQLEPRTKRYYHEFYQCADCSKIYWRGSHYDGLREKVERALAPEQSLDREHRSAQKEES